MSELRHSAGAKLGVLGGMGPLATIDFLRKLVERTPGSADQDHIPMILHSVPQIPDRSMAFLAGSDIPWAYLVSGLFTLQNAGAQLIAIPCNTAHVWHKRLSGIASVPVLHIGRLTGEAIGSGRAAPHRIGILATDATLRADIYHTELGLRGIAVVPPPDGDQSAFVMAGIRAVKAGDVPQGRLLLEKAAARLAEAGAEAILMACTEVPLALDGIDLGVPTIDPTTILAEACVTWWTTNFAPERAVA
jgi:aspartate racemase